MKWTWDKFGIPVSPPESGPTPMDRNPEEVILDCLKLTNTSGVRVQFYDFVGRAIVTLNATDIATSLENSRIASRQSGWDVDIYTVAQHEQIKQRAVRDFTLIETITPELARTLVDHGYFTFDDLSLIEPDVLMKLGQLDTETVDAIIEQSEIRGEPMDT
jgi:N utilization substance protein A